MQYFDMKFKANDYEENQKKLKVEFNREKDILISDKFLMAVINLDILSKSQISTVVLNIINKESWSKID